eukprot:5795046-Karenia_brevis.AAC.1
MHHRCVLLLLHFWSFAATHLKRLESHAANQGVASVEAKDADMSDATHTNMVSTPVETRDKDEAARKKASMANMCYDKSK